MSVKRLVGWSLVALVVLAIVAGAMNPMPEEQLRDQRDIEACWDAVDDELQELSTRRLMRQGCEQMEAEYDKRWR